MSWDLYVRDDEGVVQVDKHEEGGTFVLGGSKDAELNITYNYSNIFAFRTLNGKTCEDCIEWLESLIKILGTDRDEDYWESTEGNVGYCLSVILSWCQQHPKAYITIY